MATQHKEWAYHEGLITAIAVGGTFILLGTVLLSPNFFDNAGAFFGDFTMHYFPLGSGTMSWPAPAHPADHIAFYNAVLIFIAGIAVLQVIILPLRLAFKSPWRRVAETVGNLVFWAGAAIVAYYFLLSGTVTGWFQFWTILIMLIGVSLIVRGIVLFARRRPSLRSTMP